MSGPLEGFRIMDVCRVGPGRVATGLLADYGADVISIVEPGYAQRLIPYGVPPLEGGLANRRNKRSLFLNLKAESGREVFFRLAERSHAILESNRPGVAKRLGIDYASVKQVNPAIVYCALSGHGQSGPYQDISGHDLSYQAVGGLVPIDESGHPYIPPYNQADIKAAWNAALALLIGLLYQSKTGMGQYIDVAISDSAVTIPPSRMPDELLSGHYPCYNLYETKDSKYIALSIIEPHFWQRLCRLFEREAWIPHQLPQGQLKEKMFSFFRKTFKTKTQAEWLKILKENDIEFGPVNRTLEEVANDPHNRARGMILEVIDPETEQKTYQPGFALKFSQTPAALWYGPTLIGAETGEILKELGYSETEITKLKNQGVIE